jgi:glycosyltransferase involved in cell wall biosynthesis
LASTAADDLARLSRLPRGKFEVIYNPICPPKRIVATEEAEQLWKGNGPRIITVGSMKEQKNHALLLEAFARLPDREAQLMILGEGLLRAALERRAAALGIADRLVMPGFRLDPWPFLASANLFVLSSDYEGFANVVAEALYAGLKVVSTDCVAGPGEILDGGRYGTLVPCRDPGALSRAIEAALADQPDAKRLRARALEVSGPRTIERYAELLAAKS